MFSTSKKMRQFQIAIESKGSGKNWSKPISVQATDGVITLQESTDLSPYQIKPEEISAVPRLAQSNV